MKTENVVLCDTQIEPDGTVLVIEDVGAHGIPGTYVPPDISMEPGVPWHALWVRTMSADECSVAGRLVRVRVLTGSSGAGLGELVFDGNLELSSGVLAIGDSHNRARVLLSGSPARLRMSVFVDHVVDALRFPGDHSQYPLSGPSDVTVLLHDQPDLGPAISNTARRHFPDCTERIWAAGARQGAVETHPPID